MSISHLDKKVKDLEFLLRKSQVESRTKIKDILYQILEVYDGFERLLNIALKENWPEEVHTFILERFTLTGKKLLQVLQRSGGCQINSLEQPFNCEYHEMIEEVFNPDVPVGQIIKVHQEGFVFGSEVLRMAKVTVATDKR